LEIKVKEKIENTSLEWTNYRAAVRLTVDISMEIRKQKQ
jgi:hypothetical protein